MTTSAPVGPHRTLVSLPYFADWEAESEAAGPITEAYCPMGRLPDGSAFWESAPPAAWQTPRVPEFPYIPQAARAWEGKRKPIDMGGEPSNGRVMPSALLWTASAGRDMRDVSVLAAGSADLVFCSHAIEHVPAEDVPAMLRAWMALLERGGEMFILAPHRCSVLWSPVLNPAVRPVHRWAPACATVGNLLVSLGMELVEYDSCVSDLHIWLLWARKP